MKYLGTSLRKLYNMDKSVVLLSVFLILSSIVNYAFQIMLGNMLSLSNFGDFNTIYSLSTNLTCLYSPLAVYLCRVSAENQTNLRVGRPIYQKVFRFTLGMSLVVFCIGTSFFSNSFGRIFGVESFFLGFMITIMTVIAGIYIVLNGMLQGINKLAWYGFLSFIFMIIKFILSYIGIRLGGQIQATVWAILISYIVVISLISVIISMTVKRQDIGGYKDELQSIEYRELFRLYGFTFLDQILVSLYINGGEIILMNYLYDSESVGIYSLAATVAKVSMYILSIFTAAMLPRIASDWTKGKNVKRTFYAALMFSFVVGFLWVLFLMTVGIYIIPKLFGAGYYQALLNIKYIALWVIGIGMMVVVNTFYLAINRLEIYLKVLSVVTMVIVGYVVFGAINVLYVPVLIGFGILAVMMFAIVDVKKLKNPHIAEKGKRT